MAKARPTAGSAAGLKRGAGFELVITRLDLVAGQRPEPVHAELFAAEAAHDRSVDDGALQFGKIQISVAGRNAPAREVADEAAGEGIARAGRVEDVLEQVARRDEVAAAAEQDGAILAPLDDQGVRPHLQDL